MDNAKLGKFIAEQRKSKQMTQKELAGRLNITDKAVSKWERGLSCPDISLLSGLSEALGVTVGELLNCECEKKLAAAAPVAEADRDIDDISNVLQYAGETVKNKIVFWQKMGAWAFSVALFIGLAVCIICDLAVFGTLTWSYYPISSILFAWLVFFPVVRFWKKGAAATLFSLTVCILPFLYVLNEIIAVSDLLMPIGIRCALLALAYLWIIFFLNKILRNRKLLVIGLAVLLASPLYFLISYVVSCYVGSPVYDVWTAVDIAGFTLIGAVCIIKDMYCRWQHNCH